jgi:hypothetical protein
MYNHDRETAVSLARTLMHERENASDGRDSFRSSTSKDSGIISSRIDKSGTPKPLAKGSSFRSSSTGELIDGTPSRYEDYIYDKFKGLKKKPQKKTGCLWGTQPVYQHCWGARSANNNNDSTDLGLDELPGEEMELAMTGHSCIGDRTTRRYPAWVRQNNNLMQNRTRSLPQPHNDRQSPFAGGQSFKMLTTTDFSKLVDCKHHRTLSLVNTRQIKRVHCFRNRSTLRIASSRGIENRTPGNF